MGRLEASGRFVLHARLTRGCNADCAYCSSGGGSKRAAAGGPSAAAGGAATMSPEDFERSLLFVRDVLLPRFGRGGGLGAGSIQYVGGEILMLPKERLRACVLAGRRILGPCFSDFTDGAQSNLAFPPERVLELNSLFSSRVSSSVDRRGGARTLAGSPDRYREAAAAGRKLLAVRRKAPPGLIFVVDREGVGRVEEEMSAAEAEGSALTLRAVFPGRSAVDPASVDDLRSAYASAFDRWLLRSKTSLWPHRQLLEARLAAAGGCGTGSGKDGAGGEDGACAQDGAGKTAGKGTDSTGCPFQDDCARSSLDLEPDGSLFVCLDMADCGHLPLGNALEGRFDEAAWAQASARESLLPAKCDPCPWRRECRGGCGAEALSHSGSLSDPTPLCPVWEGLFARIDAAIGTYGSEAIGDWLSSLD